MTRTEQEGLLTFCDYKGFLQPRTRFRGFKLAARLDDNVFGHVVAVPEPKAYFNNGQGVDYPLFTRGWTYQEHQLSPRILVYGSCEMIYWCAESSHRDGGNEHPYWQEHNQYAGSLFYQAQLGASGAATEHPKSWGDIVENYSQRHLTVEDDKLPALAAVAERYAEIAPVTEYLAGMWRQDLLLQCLWRVWDPKKTRRPKSYRAPSWSWAALDGEVYPWTPPDDDATNDKTERRVTCQLLHAETTLRSQKMRFGGASAGLMRVRAKMRPVLVLFNQDSRRPALNLCHGRDPDATDEDLALLMQLGGVDSRLTLNIDVAADWSAGAEVVLWSVEVYANYHVGPQGEIQDGEGILLQPVMEGAAASVDVFRRVGQISAQSQEYMREPYWFDERDSTWAVITIV